MVRKYAMTENEFLAMHIDPEDGHLRTVRENGDSVDFGVALGPAVTDAGIAEKIADTGSQTNAQLSNTFAIFNPAGLIDWNGTVDSAAALEAYLNATPAGVTVVFPPGSTIKVLSLVTLTKPVEIDGRGSTIHTDSTNGIFAVPAAASGSKFRNLHIQGVRPATYTAAQKAFNFTGIPSAWVSHIACENVSVDGFGYGGFYGSHIRYSVFRDCTVENSVYVGFQFLSPLNVELFNPTIRNLAGIPANNFMQSYPIAWTRDQTKASIVDYPNAENCTTWGGLIETTGWEGVDTHGGRNIRTIGTNIFGCMHGVAYVPCPDTNGVDQWAPQDCVVAFCTIDSRTQDASKATGIKMIGAGNSGNRVQAATGTIIGNTIKGHGRGTLTTGATADPSTVGGAIQLYQTDGVKVDATTIIEPNPFGISLWYDNTNLQIGTTTVVDPWSDTFASPAAVAIRSTGNTVTIGAVKLVRGAKVAVNVAKVGLYCSNNAKNTITLTGGADFEAATTPTSGGGTGTIRSITNGVEQGAGVGVPNVGIWRRGAQWWNTNAAASASPGWVNTVAGGASSAVWAASTAYVAGQWIRTSTGKVMECVAAGTSGTTEPTLTTVGETVVDGGVQWIYRATTSASFKAMAALGA